MQLEKVTKRSKPETKRTYDDACGLAHALDLLGERWAMLILRELTFGGRRFSDLKGDLPGISANVLAQRLAELEERGLVRKLRLPPPASVQVYEATDWALEAAPLIGRLGKWAARSPRHDPTLPLSHVSIMMSMQVMIDPGLAEGLGGRFGFRFGEVSYVAELSDGEIAVERGPLTNCDVTFNGTPEGLAAVIYGGAPLDTLDVVGDLDLARRYVTIFPLPDKAG
jgi:DNA-binding HxlR family transcriptional regulator